MAPYNKHLDREITFESHSGQSSQHSTEVFFVSCYSDFEKLAHGPRGTEASNSIYVYEFHPSDGSMVLQNATGKDVTNPAFTRFHPRLNIVYTCTEDITSEGKIIAYSIDADGCLTKISEALAGGTSTCYLTIDSAQENLLVVNYWDSTIIVIPISQETGKFTGPIKSVYDPKGGKGLISAARKDGGVNHSHNDESTIKMRQADPHSHAIVLDPFVGRIAYVPCLGKDVIREFLYNSEDGRIEKELNYLPSGLSTGHPDGPRYVEFHPKFDIMYVVNELSSTIAVFSVNRQLIRKIDAATKSIRVIPKAFPTTLNTCGRISVHQSGRFVLVSNRGHQSIAVMKVKEKGSRRGELEVANFFHTRGETPRHFKFDSSGQFLLVANQDTDNVSVFNFNQCNGDIKFTGNEYRVPSPNFICSCPLEEHSLDNYDDFAIESEAYPQEVNNEFGVGKSTSSEDSNISIEMQLAEALSEIKMLKKRLNQVG